jgi:hypothetical protein
LKRSHYIAFTAVVLLVVIILALTDRTTAQLKIAISSLFCLFGLIPLTSSRERQAACCSAAAGSAQPD